VSTRPLRDLADDALNVLDEVLWGAAQLRAGQVSRDIIGAFLAGLAVGDQGRRGGKK